MKLYADRLGMLAFIGNISLSMVEPGLFNNIPILDVNNGSSALNNGNYC